MILNLKKLLAYLYILYAITTIFVPKFAIGFELSGIYLLEAICIILSFLLLLSGKLKFSLIEKNYLIYMLFAFFSWFLGIIYTGEVNSKSFFLLFKYTSFILLIPVAFYLKSFMTESVLKKILFSQLLFVVIAGGYTAYHTIFHPIDILTLSGSYTPEYRLIGVTGNILTSNGLVEIGHTSVPMGVYIAFLFLVYLSLYFHIKKLKYLIASFILFIGLMLTYSRSGFLTMGIGVIYLFIKDIKKKKVFNFVISVGSAILLIIIIKFQDILNFLSNFGVIGKIILRTQTEFDIARIGYWDQSINYILNHPLILFFGTGYGTLNYIFGFGTLESLLFDTLFESGILALLFLLLFFYYTWKYASRYSISLHSNYYIKAVLYGYRLAIPGILFACSVGGNSIQTDFIAPVFFLALGICLSYSSENTLRTLASS